jgi:hypothetical protein
LLTRDRRRFWIVDFGVSMKVSDAALYERPFALAETRVKAKRAVSKTTIAEWWKHERPRVEMRLALKGARCYLVTPRVGVHRLFVWGDAPLLPDSATFVFATADDYLMGLLHSRIHEVWGAVAGNTGARAGEWHSLHASKLLRDVPDATGRRFQRRCGSGPHTPRTARGMAESP